MDELYSNDALSSEDDIDIEVKKKKQFVEVWKRLCKNRLAVVGLIVLILLLLVAVWGAIFIDYDNQVIKQDVMNRLKPASSEHIFGTDELGRDLFARVIYGARYSLVVGFISVSIALIVGGTLGAIAGFYGGRLDDVIMRIMDIFLAIPNILLAIALMSALGASLFNLMVAVGISSIPRYARIVRSSVMTVKDMEFVEAARAIGARDTIIIVRHIIPNSLAPVIVQGTLGVASAILSTAALSFIGLGIQPPDPEWGAMLNSGRTFLRDAPHITVIPGIAIMITILSLNMLGDGLRDALDPKLK